MCIKPLLLFLSSHTASPHYSNHGTPQWTPSSLPQNPQSLPQRRKCTTHPLSAIGPLTPLNPPPPFTPPLFCLQTPSVEFYSTNTTKTHLSFILKAFGLALDKISYFHSLLVSSPQDNFSLNTSGSPSSTRTNLWTLQIPHAQMERIYSHKSRSPLWNSNLIFQSHYWNGEVWVAPLNSLQNIHVIRCSVLHGRLSNLCSLLHSQSTHHKNLVIFSYPLSF